MTDRWAAIVDPRFLIALIVLGMFGWALSADPDDLTMKGALIAGFAGAWGYYLGSSKGTAETNARMDKALDVAKANSQANAEPDVVLKPGETAQAEESK